MEQHIKRCVCMCVQSEKQQKRCVVTSFSVAVAVERKKERRFSEDNLMIGV